MRKSVLLAMLLMPGLIDAVAQNTTISFDFAVKHYPESRIIQSLLDGHRSEVRYDFRLLRKATGLRKILGDRLVAEEQTTYIARWDAFDESFVVLIDGAAERVFKDANSFLEFFLSVENRVMTIEEILTDQDYLFCRWRIQPVKLVPPLTLMTLIKSDLQTISSWQQTEMKKAIR